MYCPCLALAKKSANAFTREGEGGVQVQLKSAGVKHSLSPQFE